MSLLSRSLNADRLLNGTISYGSFNTKLFDMDFNTGRFGTGGKQRFMFDLHDMQSDGYQTFNFQHRVAFSAKYNYQVSDNTSVEPRSRRFMHLSSNTPNQKGSTRAQVAQFGDNFLMTDDPSSPLYYKYNFYSIPTDFEYFGFRTLLGHGWSIRRQGVHDAVLQQAELQDGVTNITTTSATDKLNRLSQVRQQPADDLRGEHGRLPHRAVVGIRVHRPLSDPPRIPARGSTRRCPISTRCSARPRLQPYAEYSWRALPNLTITPGVKYSYYQQDLTQFADNGKTVGNLNGAALGESRRRIPRVAAVARRAPAGAAPTGRCTRSTARGRTFRPRASST